MRLKQQLLLLVGFLLGIPSMLAQDYPLELRVTQGNSFYTEMEARPNSAVLSQTQEGVYEGTFSVTNNNRLFIFWSLTGSTYTFYGNSAQTDIDFKSNPTYTQTTLKQGSSSSDECPSGIYAWGAVPFPTDLYPQGTTMNAKVDLKNQSVTLTLGKVETAPEEKPSYPAEMRLATGTAASNLGAYVSNQVLEQVSEGIYECRKTWSYSPSRQTFLIYGKAEDGTTTFYGNSEYTPINFDESAVYTSSDITTGSVNSGSSIAYSPANVFAWGIDPYPQGINEKNKIDVKYRIDLTGAKPTVTFTAVPEGADIEETVYEYFIVGSLTGGTTQNNPVQFDATADPNVFTLTMDVPVCSFNETVGGSDGQVAAGNGYYFMLTNSKDIGNKTTFYGLAKGTPGFMLDKNTPSTTITLIPGTAAAQPGWIIDLAPGKSIFTLDVTDTSAPKLTVELLATPEEKPSYPAEMRLATGTATSNLGAYVSNQVLEQVSEGIYECRKTWSYSPSKQTFLIYGKAEDGTTTFYGNSEYTPINFDESAVYTSSDITTGSVNSGSSIAYSPAGVFAWGIDPYPQGINEKNKIDVKYRIDLTGAKPTVTFTAMPEGAEPEETVYEYFIVGSLNGGATQNAAVQFEKTENPNVFTLTMDVPVCKFNEQVGGSDGITTSGDGYYFMITNLKDIGNKTTFYGRAKGTPGFTLDKNTPSTTITLVSGTAADQPGYIIDLAPGKSLFTLDVTDTSAPELTVELLEFPEETVNEVTFNFTGVEDAYKYVQIMDWDAEDGTFETPESAVLKIEYTESASYYFSAAEGYQIEITCDGYAGDNPEDPAYTIMGVGMNEDAQTQIFVSVFAAANGYEFNVEVTEIPVPVWTIEGQFNAPLTGDLTVSYEGNPGPASFYIVKTEGEKKTYYGAPTTDDAANQILSVDYTSKAVMQGSTEGLISWVFPGNIANGVNWITISFDTETFTLTVKTKVIDTNSYLGTSETGAPEEPNKDFVLTAGEDGTSLTGTFTIQPNQNFNIWYKSPFSMMDEDDAPEYMVLGPATQTDVEFSYFVSDFSGALTNENPSYWTLNSDQALELTFTVSLADQTLTLVNGTELPEPTYMGEASAFDVTTNKPIRDYVAELQGAGILVSWDGQEIAPTAASDNLTVDLYIENQDAPIATKLALVPFDFQAETDGPSTDANEGIALASIVVTPGNATGLSITYTEKWPFETMVEGVPYGYTGNMRFVIPAGLIQNAAGDINPAQTIEFGIAPITEIEPAFSPEAENGQTAEAAVVESLEEITITWEGASDLEWSGLEVVTFRAPNAEGDVDSYDLVELGKASFEGSTLTLDVAEYTEAYGEYQLIMRSGSVVFNVGEELHMNQEIILNYAIVNPAAGTLVFDTPFVYTVAAPGNDATVVTVPVSLDLDDTFEYQGFQFDITLPEGLAVCGVSLNEELVTTDGGITFNKVGENVYRVLALLNMKAEGVSLLEDIVSFDVTLAEGSEIEEGEYEVTLSNIEFSYTNGNPVTFEDFTGFVVVEKEIIPVTSLEFTSAELLFPSLNNVWDYETNPLYNVITEGQTLAITLDVLPVDYTTSVEITADLEGVTVTYNEEEGYWELESEGLELSSVTEVQLTAIANEGESVVVTETWSISIKPVILGDANDNGDVTVADVVTTANYIATLYTEVAVFDYPNADVITTSNGITVEDLTAIVNIIMGIDNNKQNIRRSNVTVANNDCLVADNIRASKAQATLGVNLENTTAYSALQATVIVPEGMTVYGVTAGPRAAAHDLVYNMVDGKVYVVLYSLTNASFAEGDGALFNILYTADSNCGELVIEAIHASDARSDGYDLQYEGGLNASATGIGAIEADIENGARYFDVNGYEVRNPEAGQILIRVKGNESTKVLVK